MQKRLLAVIVSVLVAAIFIPYERVQASSIKDEIISIARSQLGTPYKFGGTTPSGFDCSGFIRFVFNGVDIDLPRTASGQYSAGEPVSKANLEVGDLVFFETYKPGPSHSGIYIGDNRFIHASTSNGISISNINDPYYWGSRYLGAKRVLEPEVTLQSLPLGQYHDVSPQFWAYDSIKTLGEQNIIRGYDVSLFKPNNNVTRAQVAIILTRLFDLSPTGESKGFNDVSPSFHAYNEIQAVADAGFFNGDSNGNFRPNDRFTREHIALVFARAFDLPEASLSRTFTDVSESRHSYDAIQRLASSGITTGYEDGTFRPSHATTRAQLAVFLDKALH